MPVCIAKRDDKWRVVECDSGNIVKNRAGTAVDGGGHTSKEAAKQQAKAINRSISE